jgi:hypothetical protein
MNGVRILISLWLVTLAAACSPKIGDSCSSSLDCSTDGTRICDSLSPNGGYCTIAGCDYGTCPSEAVCVRFFPGLMDARTCATQSDCPIDQVCTLGGQCAPTSIEVRYCMATCSSAGDCRDGYECRTEDLMKIHGGEPVPDPNASNATPPNVPFCASQRACTLNSDCNTGEICDPSTSTCRPQ